MNSELLVIDEYIQNMSEYYNAQGLLLESVFDDYRKCIKMVLDTAILDGEVHNALQVFIEMADALENELANLSQCANIKLDDYIVLIDQTDKYLY